MTDYEAVRKAIKAILCLKCDGKTFKTDKENPRSPNYNHVCRFVKCSREEDISAILQAFHEHIDEVVVEPYQIPYIGIWDMAVKATKDAIKGKLVDKGEER